VQWAPPATDAPSSGDEPRGELFANRSPSTLTLGDALTTGFGIIAKPTFIIPVLILGVIVNTVVSILLGPLITSGITPGRTLGPAEIQTLLTGTLATVVIGIIGGILINVYGQIWAVEASSGPLPTMNRVLEIAGRRWIAIILTGLAVAVITLALLFGSVLLTGVAAAAVGELGILVAVALVVVYIFVAARLSMAGWLAAEGHGVSESVQGSWEMTSGSVLRIIGWSLAYGLVFAIIAGILGGVLGMVPYIGAGIAQAIGIALGYGAGVTLFRRTQAAAKPVRSATPSSAVA
jgi:hypothetical protein